MAVLGFDARAEGRFAVVRAVLARDPVDGVRFDARAGFDAVRFGAGGFVRAAGFVGALTRCLARAAGFFTGVFVAR